MVYSNLCCLLLVYMIAELNNLLLLKKQFIDLYIFSYIYISKVLFQKINDKESDVHQLFDILVTFMMDIKHTFAKGNLLFHESIYILCSCI